MPDLIGETERMLARHRERVDRARAARAEHADDTYRATSDDRTVSAVVDAAGRVVSVDVQQAALNRGDAARLGRAVQQAVARAQEEAATAQLSAVQAALGVPADQLASAHAADEAVQAAARALRDTQ